MKNKNLIYILGAGAIGLGIWYLLKPKSDPQTQPELMPSPGYTPTISTIPTIPTIPTNPTIPIVAAPTIGDAVITTSTQFGIDKNSSKVFTNGGSDGNGQIEALKYAGTIVGFVPFTNWAIVQNYTYPMIDDDDNIISQFRLNKTKLIKG